MDGVRANDTTGDFMDEVGDLDISFPIFPIHSLHLAHHFAEL